MLTTPSHPLPPACPLLRGHLKGCLWRPSKAALLKTGSWSKGQAYHHQLPGPTYAPGQKVWLSTKHIPVCTEEHFHWPFGTSNNNKSFYSILSVSQRCVCSIMQLFPSWMQFALHHHALALLCNKNISNIHIHAADCIPIFCLLHFDKIVFRCKSGLAPVSFWTHSRT